MGPQITLSPYNWCFEITRAEHGKVTKYQDLKNALKDEWELKDISIIGCYGHHEGQPTDSIPGKPDK